MLPRTRYAASRVLSAATSTARTSLTPSRLATTHSIHRHLHLSTHPSASPTSTTAAHAATSHTTHVDPRVAKYLSDDVNGWFLGEVPGYRGDYLPGGDSRFICTTFLVLMTASAVAFVMAKRYKPEPDLNVWAKEYVLNVERYKVPDCPDPFPEAEHE